MSMSVNATSLRGVRQACFMTGALFAPATGDATQGTVFMGQFGDVLDKGKTTARTK
jgi:hypothetical protein